MEKHKLIKNKADRMGPGGSSRPRTPFPANIGEHDFEIFTYQTTLWRTILFYTLSFATCGIFRLILHWFPKLFIDFRATKCGVEEANLVLIIDNHDRAEICQIFCHDHESSTDTVVAKPNGTLIELNELRWFTYRKLQYTWIDGEWSTACRAYSQITPDDLLTATPPGGLNIDDVALRRTYFGQNVMNAELTPFLQVILSEILTPFYIFQGISVIVWFIDDYVYYATLIVIMTSYSIFLTLRQTREQEKRIRSMVVEHDTVEVVRNDGRIQKVDSSELVPGDILIIPPQGCMLYCDCVLLNGSAIVNESMLTGESIPITKTAIYDDGHEKYFSIEKHSKSVIFNGTRVLQTKYYKGQHVKAFVIRTSYSTTKGQLVRAILYPKPADFTFFTQLMKFVGVLSIVAFFGSLYTMIILFYRGNPIGKVLIRALDLVTISVPPALPAVMSIGIFYAQKRLQQKSIYCISPTTINTCGAIDVVCFDKTGTLTEDGIDFYGVRVVEKCKESKIDKSQKLVFGDDVKHIAHEESCQKIVTAMATCHSLTLIQNEIHGDPLDVILFQQTGFSLEEEEEHEDRDSIESVQPILVRPADTHPNQTACSIIKQFTFSSALQRMSVIVNRDNGGQMMAYCKGSPEMIVSLCIPESVPENFHDVVEEFTQHGYRLIAVAEKILETNEVQKLSRNAVECELSLIGLIALENRLKPVTTSIIRQLNEANVRSVMVTGDSLLTALAVARDCEIIRNKKCAYLIEHEPGVLDQRGRTILTIRPRHEYHENNTPSRTKITDLSKMSNPDCQFAISGSTFAVINQEYPDLVDQLVCVCNVFARMTPDQKQLLVEHLQLVGNIVAMCGDGANDCAALKAAHAGISLSDAEASIAAPFTSKVADIQCVITMISEGRAALVTSFSAFLCMAGYSLTQFVSILLLYWISSSYSQMQFLFIDMPIVTVLAWLSSRTSAYSVLAPTPPPSQILSVSSMVSLFGQLSIGAFAQILVFCWITLWPWFEPFIQRPDDNEKDRMSMQGTAIFYVSIFHYIVLYTVFAKGPPYRGSIWSNKPFFIALVSVTTVCVGLVLIEIDAVLKFLGCVRLPLEFRSMILLIATLTAIISMIFNRFLDKISENIRKRIRQRQKTSQTVLNGNKNSVTIFSVL